MTPNQSLELSCRMQHLMRQDMLQFLCPMFPIEAVQQFMAKQSDRKKRDRVYNTESTLLTMLVTAVQPDKSLQNSVNIFQEIFRRNRESILKSEKEQLETLQLPPRAKERTGRSKTYKVKLPVSKLKDISSNTAAYSKARGRVELALIDSVFKATTSYEGMTCIKPWHGMLAYNTDGTYFQMQDAEAIPEKYRAQKTQDGVLQGYPQGLLQVLTQHGSGLISGYAIAGRSESELTIASKLLDQLPPNSLLLADDLYNCYAFLARVREKVINIIVPDKKDRRYTVVDTLGVGDEIVELTKPRDATAFDDKALPAKLTVRRIEYPDTIDPTITHVILSSLLDGAISAMEIVHKYTSRWDVEITIREIKTMMDMNIARAKSEEMVFKELGIALCAYNLLRRIITQSVEKTDFSPQEDFFQTMLAPCQNSLVDRKGRVYNRWSPGRPVTHNTIDAPTPDTLQAGASLSQEN